MDINRLSQEELSYELEIRDLPGGNVDEMRKNLRLALKAEQDNKSLIVSPYPFTFEQDKDALEKKVRETVEL